MSVPNVTSISAAAYRPPTMKVSNSYWTSLAYFNAYRVALALLFLLSTTQFGDIFNFGNENPRLFFGASVVYFACGVGLHALLLGFKGHFNAHLTAQVLLDIVAITLLLHASGGYRSGLALMLLISLAGAALVSHGRMILFYAALATIAVLTEHLVRVLSTEVSPATFVQPGLISIAFFVTALITNFLAKRVVANEDIARERGIRLANQLRVNELIIQDAQDGVVVVDPSGAIRQFNPQAEALLGPMTGGVDVARQAEPLAAALQRWRSGVGPNKEQIEFPASGKRARARFLDAGMPAGGGSVIYLEDESKLEERARQHKLAALGRLTANIAHEIRNPLSAIVHAADLMEEENRVPQRLRLTRIIRDNAARLERMVHDVLELNRRDRAQRESLRLDAFLESFVAEFAENVGMDEAGIRLVDTDRVVVEFDRVHLYQVLWNLVRNAWRHSAHQPGSVLIQLSRTPECVALHIIDDGGGVPKSLQPQLFEPFFTTYSSGTGLGLYIARELCGANGARLEYIARDKGADFCIVWPHTPH